MNGGWLSTSIPSYTVTADAEDILQLTKLQLWHIFDQFEQGTNFLAWARQVAFYQMLNFRRAEKVRHLPLANDVLESPRPRRCRTFR